MINQWTKILPIFSSHFVLIVKRCHKGNTPLHTAAEHGQLETCQVLLRLSPAMLDQVNFDGVSNRLSTQKNNKGLKF